MTAERLALCLRPCTLCTCAWMLLMLAGGGSAAHPHAPPPCMRPAAYGGQGGMAAYLHGAHAGVRVVGVVQVLHGQVVDAQGVQHLRAERHQHRTRNA